MAVFQSAVLIPFIIPQRDFNIPHSRFGKTPCHQTLPTEVFSCLVINAVQSLRLFGFRIQIHQCGNFRLHPERQLIRIDHPFDFIIQFDLRQMPFVHCLQQAQLFALLTDRGTVVIQKADLCFFRCGVGITNRGPW